MFPRRVYRYFYALCLFLASGFASAAVMVVDFESFTDFEALTSQVAGLTFQNSTVLSAGVSLNESDFPPLSGFNVVVDDGGAITIDFATPVSAISGYFTYVSQLTLDAFDSGANLIATDLSNFLTNSALSGDAGSSPNERLSVASATGIARIVITGDPAGFSFVMDDLTVTARENGNNVPEPGTLPLVLMAAFAAAIGAGSRRKHLTT